MNVLAQDWNAHAKLPKETEYIYNEKTSRVTRMALSGKGPSF